MKKKLLILVFVILIIVLAGAFYFFKVYNNDKNTTERYLEKNRFSCVGNSCTKKEKNVKYNYDVKTKDLYISKDKYVLVVGRNYPVLKFKNGNDVCNYEVDDYKVGDHIDDDYSYEKECQEFIEEINMYIDEYKKIVNDIK